MKKSQQLSAATRSNVYMALRLHFFASLRFLPNLVRHSGLPGFSFRFEEPREILSCLGTGAAMDAGADFFVP